MKEEAEYRCSCGKRIGNYKFKVAKGQWKTKCPRCKRTLVLEFSVGQA